MLDQRDREPQSVVSPSLVPDHQAIDFEHLFRMTLGDQALQREVLQLFDRQADMLLARIQASDASAAAGLAHILKGSARGIGAWQVATAAEAMEAACASGAGRDQAVQDLSQAVAGAHAAIVLHVEPV